MVSTQEFVFLSVPNLRQSRTNLYLAIEFSQDVTGEVDIKNVVKSLINVFVKYYRITKIYALSKSVRKVQDQRIFGKNNV